MSVLFLIFLSACCGYGLIQGGAPERIGAGLLITAYALTVAAHQLIDEPGFRVAMAGTAIVDLALLLGLTWLARRSTRYWPVWIAGWQLASVVAHAAKLIHPGLLPHGYAIEAEIWSYPIVGMLGIGTWRHQRRRGSITGDPSWKQTDRD